MTNEHQLDGDTLDLINQLCTRGGRIMEDTAPLALQLSQAGEEAAAKLRDLIKSVLSISALIAAASALADI